MALPYITGRQGQVLSTEVVEKMAAEGKIGTGSGSGFEKITSANDLLTIPSEETMGKIYQYEGKDYLINVTEKSEELSVDVDPDIFYNKVQVKDKDFKFKVVEDTWKLDQTKDFDVVDWSESFKAYSSDTVSFGIEPNKQYTVVVNYEGYQANIPMGPYYEGFNGIVTSAEEYPQGYYNYIEGTYYLDPDLDAQKYLVTIMGYDGIHFDSMHDSEPAFGGTYLVVCVVLNKGENVVYPTLGEEIDILDGNGKSIIKSMQEVDLNEYGITVKGTKENSNFIVRSNSVTYNKYDLYQVTADSKNLPGTSVQVDSDNLKVYINNEVDVTKCINNFGGVPQGSEFYVVSYDLLTTTKGEDSNFTVVVKDGEKWKEFLDMKDVPQAARKEITFKCVYDTTDKTEEALEADSKMLYADNDLLYIQNSDSSVKQNYMNVLTQAIEVKDSAGNLFDWNHWQYFESDIIKGGDNFTIKIDDEGNVTAIVNPRIKESITYFLYLAHPEHPESPDSYWEYIGYTKLPFHIQYAGFLPLSNLIYASKTYVDVMAGEGIIIKTNSNGFTENLESITLEGSKISHIYNGTEESISNELFSSTPFEKSLINFRLEKMYDKLPDGPAVNTFLTVDDKGNYIWKKLDTSKVIYVDSIQDLTEDQLLTLIKNPDMVVAHPEVHSCSCSSIYTASIDYYSFAGFAGVAGSGHSVSAYYVCYTDYRPLSSYTTATRKGFWFNAYLDSTGKFESVETVSSYQQFESDVLIEICPSDNPTIAQSNPFILVQAGQSVNNITWIGSQQLANALKQYLTNEAFATELQKHLNIQTLFTALEPSLNDWYAKKQQPTEGPTQ